MHPAVPPNPLGPSTTTPPRPGPGDRRYLTADDVNIIRQMEWARKDASVKVRFDNDVRKHYLQFSNEVEKEFNLLAPTDQALRILEHRDLPEGLRKDVRILTDPAPLLEYRRSIQPMVQAGCATSNCHGGSSAGKFFLYPSVENDQATLTNFYLLNQYRQTIDGVERRVIDRTYPDKSLLEQYALPADQAEFRHPEVPKGTPWRGIPGPFKNKTEAGYKRVSDWMGSLIPQQPEYGITFTADRPPQAVEPSHTRPGAAPEKP